MEPDVIDRYVDTGLAGDPDPETKAWLQMLHAAAGLRWTAFHRPDPVPYGSRTGNLDAARVFAERTANTVLEADVVHVGRALLIGNGDIAGAIAATRRQLVLGDICEDLRERHLGLIEATNTLTWVAGEAREMLPTTRRALAIGRELRPHDVNHSTMTLMATLYLTGGWDEIPALIDEHIAAFAAQEDSSCPFAVGGFPLGSVVLARRGDSAAARALLDRMPQSDSRSAWSRRSRRWRRSPSATPRRPGRPPNGSSTAVSGTSPRNPGSSSWSCSTRWSRSRTGAESAPRCRRSGRAPGIWPLPGRPPIVPRDSPWPRRGRNVEAIGYLERAIEGFDRLSVFDAARTREALAGVDATRRAELLGSALATYEGLGASPSVAALRASLLAPADAQGGDPN